MKFIARRKDYAGNPDSDEQGRHFRTQVLALRSARQRRAARIAYSVRWPILRSEKCTVAIAEEEICGSSQRKNGTR